MRAIIGGIEQRLELFIMRLSYSGHMFACVSLREDLPALMSGMLSAFDYFGGLPATAVFDNAKTAVNHVLRGRERVENPAFLAFRGAIALEVQFAAPRRGNEKGGVEGAHGYVEDNFFRPMPSFLTIDEINDALRMFCTDNMKRIHATHRERIGDRFEREKTTLRPLPARLPDACVTTFAKINKFSEVHLKTNRYSVPTKFAYRDAFVETWNERIRIRVNGEIVADHHRSALRRDCVINPLHSLEIIARKHRKKTSFCVHGGSPKYGADSTGLVSVA